MAGLAADGRPPVCWRAEPLLQLVCTVLQCDVAVLTLAAGDQMLVMRKGRLESREETEAGPLWQHRGALPIPTCCAALVLPDASADHRRACCP